MGIILVLKHKHAENSGAEIENLVRRPACPVSFSILTARPRRHPGKKIGRAL